MRWDIKTSDWIDDEGYSQKAKRWGILRKVDLPPEDAPAPEADPEAEAAAEQLPALLDEFSALEAEVADEAALADHSEARAAASRASSGRFGPGNPGKPKGARNKRGRKRPNISLDVLLHFHRHHEDFLAALLEKDPAAYLRLVAEHQVPKSQW